MWECSGRAAARGWEGDRSLGALTVGGSVLERRGSRCFAPIVLQLERGTRLVIVWTQGALSLTPFTRSLSLLPSLALQSPAYRHCTTGNCLPEPLCYKARDLQSRTAGGVAEGMGLWEMAPSTKGPFMNLHSSTFLIVG